MLRCDVIFTTQTLQMSSMLRGMKAEVHIVVPEASVIWAIQPP